MKVKQISIASSQPKSSGVMYTVLTFKIVAYCHAHIKASMMQKLAMCDNENLKFQTKYTEGT